MIDLLADVLEATRTDGVVFARVRFHAPWRLRCDPAPLAGFHIVARGSCDIELDGDTDPIRLEAGDIALVTRGEGHHLYDVPDSPVTPLADLVGEVEPGHVTHLRRGPEDAAETVLVCGGYLFQQPGPHPLLAALPPVVHLRSDEIGRDTRLIVDQLLAEAAERRDGSKTVVNRLVDILLVHMLRTVIDRQPSKQLGWLAALRDPAITRAMQRIHGDYGSELTLEMLAGEAGMSLSSFKKRFRELVGDSPGSYLTRLRLDTAARLLRDQDEPVAVVAGRVGYTSEFAFNRAFTRATGHSPGRYRRHVREHPPTSPVERATQG